MLTAANGRRGLEMLAKQQLDLALPDNMMPVMDGSTMSRTVMENFKLEKNPSRYDELNAGSKCRGAMLKLRGVHAQAV